MTSTTADSTASSSGAGRRSKLLNSTIGLKALMAATGILLVGFVVGHMLGNLKLYLGAHDLNAYGEGLREFGYPILPHGAFLWIARIVLLVALVAHVRAAVLLTRRAQRARPTAYKMTQRKESTYASHSMRWGGVFLLAFVIFHILHLTTGDLHPSFEHGLVYENVVAGFSVFWAALIYLFAMIPLGLHLYHGTWSCLQTLGASHPKYDPWRRRLALAVSLVVVAGNISFPIAVLAGWVS